MNLVPNVQAETPFARYQQLNAGFMMVSAVVHSLKIHIDSVVLQNNVRTYLKVPLIVIVRILKCSFLELETFSLSQSAILKGEPCISKLEDSF